MKRVEAIIHIQVIILYAAIVVGANFQPAWGYPQFADFISSKSGKQVACSYCHVSDQGPAGSGPGQIGSLTDQQLALMHTSDSPVLNHLGHCLLQQLGYEGLKQSLFEPKSILAAVKTCQDAGCVPGGSEIEHVLNPDRVISFPQSPWDRYHLATWAVLVFIAALLVFAAVIIVRGRK